VRYVLIPFVILFYLIGLASLRLAFGLMGEGWDADVKVNGLACYFNPNREPPG
jgi:hypothetical protein